MDSRTFI